MLVCCKHFCRDFESAGDASLLRLRPANLRWSHCSQPNGRRDDVDGPVAHNQPLVLRCWEHDKTATFGPHAAVRLSAAGQQWRNSRSWPQAQLKAASCGEIRAPLFKSPVDDSEELHAQVADEQQQRDAHRPPLGALVVDVDVGDREVEHDGSDALQNLPVTIMPSTAHEEYLGEQETYLGMHGKSRVKVPLLRSTAQWCWVIT